MLPDPSVAFHVLVCTVEVPDGTLVVDTIVTEGCPQLSLAEGGSNVNCVLQSIVLAEWHVNVGGV